MSDSKQPAASAAIYQSAIEFVTAVQWRGDNLTEMQQFLAPSSPIADGGKPAGKPGPLLVYALDRAAMVTYPSLGRQVKAVDVAVGDWIVAASRTGSEEGDRDPAALQILSDGEFSRRYQPVAVEASATSADDPWRLRQSAGHQPFQLGGSLAGNHPRLSAPAQTGSDGAADVPTKETLADA